MSAADFHDASRANAIAARTEYVRWFNALVGRPDNDWKHSQPYDLAWRIVIGDNTDAAARSGFLRHGLGLFELGADQRGHAALARGHGGLHRLAARLQKARGIGQGEGARGAQRADGSV